MESMTSQRCVADLPRLDPLLLKVGEVLGDLAEGAVENRHLMLDAEAHVGVLVEGLILGRVDVGGLQGNRLVAVGAGSLIRQYQLRCFTSPRRKMISPVFNSCVSIRKAMGSAFCAGSVNFFRLSLFDSS